MTIVNCSYCGISVDVPPSRAAKFKTCSVDCMSAMFKEKRAENVSAICAVCGSEFPTKKSHLSRRKTCSKSCLAKLKSSQMSGKGNHQHGRTGAERGAAFKGGRRISSWGYVLIAVGRNKYEFEHRLLMEAHIGRKLNHDEHVHHINGNKQDNRLENLEILTKPEHVRLHNKGNPLPRDPVTQQFLPRK